MDRIRFQLDEHVPFAVAEAHRRRGIEVLTADESGLVEATDDAVLSSTSAAGRVLVTHDSDVLRLHHQARQHAGIAFCRQGTRTVGGRVTSLVLVFELLESGEMTGRLEFL